MAEIKERLIKYLKDSGISKKDFSEKTGISLWNITGKSVKSELGGEQISLIIGKYPNISPDWLLLGKGEMLRQNSVKNDDEGVPMVKIPAKAWRLYELQAESLKRKDDQISQLIEMLKGNSGSREGTVQEKKDRHAEEAGGRL